MHFFFFRSRTCPLCRDVKQVFPSRSVPYRGGLVVERVTASLSRAGCGLQNAGPNLYRIIYKPSRAVPRDACVSNFIKPPTIVSFMNVQVEELCKRVEESSLSFTKALSKSMSQSSVCACVLELKAFRGQTPWEKSQVLYVFI